MAFHIHPKWLFYRFAHPPSFEIGFRENYLSLWGDGAWAQLWNALTSEKNPNDWADLMMFSVQMQ